ncbi:hypothetical protein ACOI7N_27245 [Pseudomonas sp. P2758]|uniref:hypothetical protein n=1 Tax=Pseudomonas sp. P2758 TaxID=3409916 RepID=UPI003B5A2ECB
MDRVAYQNLRFAVEAEFLNASSNPNADQHTSVNSLMRIFLAALAQQEVQRQRSRREFKTFRRRDDFAVPGWAFKPKADK